MIRICKKSAFLLLIVILCIDCEAISTPLGNINNATLIRWGGGGRAAEVSFSVDASDPPQAVLLSFATSSGHALTASIPFQILNQIHNLNLESSGTLSFIPAALATLMLVNNSLVPQLGNGQFQITSASVFQGVMTLALSGTNSDNNPVSANLTMSIHGPSEIQVILPGVFLPVTFIIDMLPFIPPTAIVSPLHIFQFPGLNEINPLTGQVELFGGY